MVIAGGVAFLLCILAFVIGMEKGKIDANNEFTDKHNLYVKTTNYSLLRHITLYEIRVCLEQLLVKSKYSADFYADAIAKLSKSEYSILEEIEKIAKSQDMFNSEHVLYVQFKNFATAEALPRVLLCITDIQDICCDYSKVEIISAIKSIAASEYTSNKSIDQWRDLVYKKLSQGTK